MKRTITIILVFFTLSVFGQNLPDKIGEIEIQMISHHYKRNSDFDLTKRKTNNKNRPFNKLYFNSKGLLVKQINFGKQHNTDLKLTDYIKVFKYSGNKLIESINYESDYEKNIYPNWMDKYTYNQKGQLIDESTYYNKSDSLFFKKTYEYDLNSNEIKTIFNPTYYYQSDYDSINRITSLKQIYDNKIRWEWKFKYSLNKRTGIFQTHYKDDKDYSKKEIETYDFKNRIIEREETHISKSGLDEKVKLYYHENKILKRIEYYESYSLSEGYELVSFTKIKVKTKLNITEKIARRINEKIQWE